jgi:hypothetical protein
MYYLWTLAIRREMMCVTDRHVSSVHPGWQVNSRTDAATWGCQSMSKMPSRASVPATVAVIASRPVTAARAEPGVGGSMSSGDLCREALRAYERLFRALDFDEPDVSANISYSVCRTSLERRALAEPFDLAPERATRLRALIDSVEGTSDRRQLATWFAGFPELIFVELERRAADQRSAGRGPARRWADRMADRVTADRAGAAAHAMQH